MRGLIYSTVYIIIKSEYMHKTQKLCVLKDDLFDESIYPPANIAFITDSI